VQIEVRNQSSLSEEDASVLRTTMADELSARGLRTSGEGPGVASVTITLSENVQSYVWVAQIQHGDDSSVLLQSVPRETPAATAPESEKIVIHKELLWSGPAHVLDAIELPASGSTPGRLLLLELDGVTAVLTDSQGTFHTQLPVAVPHLRDPSGAIESVGIALEISFWDSAAVSEVCRISLGTSTAPNCMSTFFVGAIVGSAPAPPKGSFGDQQSLIQSPCDSGLVFLEPGNGDYSQLDSLQAYAPSGHGGALSAPIQFPGPIISLPSSSNGITSAVAQNLQNGNYEVYRITAACGQ